MESTESAPTVCSAPSEGDALSEARAIVRHLAHELRQPLSTIESIAYYLDMVLPQHDKKSRRQVEKLQRVVQQADWILSDAVHYLQASPPVPQTIDVDEFVSQSVADMAKGERLMVHMELSEEQTLVRSDPEQLRHLLRNVFSVFRAAATPGGSVRIRTCRSEKDVRIELQASGLDCEPHHVQSMLEPFCPHLPEGSGLALASAQRITEAHGGTIELETPEDTALSLTVILPAV
jgi:signal transduction histidine kinase